MTGIEIWFDGGEAYGFGNVRRARELGEVLTKRGHSVHFVPLSPNARSLLGRSEEPSNQAGLVVLDVPYRGDALICSARARRLKIVALDFEGSVAPDLIISLQAVREVPAGCRFLFGYEFAIIRAEIRSAGSTLQIRNEVLVVIGGGDRDGLTARILERNLGLPVCVVQGPAGSSLDIRHEGVRVVTNPPDLPNLMASCRWAVTTGGTTMLEMLCLGKGVHVIPRTEAENIFARGFASNNALLGVGLDSLQAPSPEQIEACGRRGSQLIDGKGIDRVVCEIEALL